MSKFIITGLSKGTFNAGNPITEANLLPLGGGTSVSGDYLPLIGGTLSGNLKISKATTWSTTASDNPIFVDGTGAGEGGFAFGVGTTLSTWFSSNDTTTTRMIDCYNDGSRIHIHQPLFVKTIQPYGSDGLGLYGDYNDGTGRGANIQIGGNTNAFVNITIGDTNTNLAGSFTITNRSTTTTGTVNLSNIGSVNVTSLGPVVFRVEADSDNATETDTATFELVQDGGFVGIRMGMDAVNDSYLQNMYASVGHNFYIMDASGVKKKIYCEGNLPTYDNYNRWFLQVNGLNGTSVLSDNIVNLIGGTNMTLTKTGNTVTFDAAAGGTSFNGGTITGDITITKSNPWLTLDSTTGTDGFGEGAGISIGESGYKGVAALHLTYTGDGYGHIGMGVVNSTTGLPEFKAMELYYQSNVVKFLNTPQVNGVNVSLSNHTHTEYLPIGGGTLTGSLGVNGNIEIGGTFINNTNSTRDKFRVWNSNIYTIGMASNFTFGSLNNDYAMTFQMNNDADRGFWWGSESHTNAQGAMSLATDGKLTVATRMRIGYGISDATLPSTSYVIDANGVIKATSFEESSLRKYKTNIKAYQGDALQLINKLDIVSFDRKDVDTKNKIGIIADDSPEEFLGETKSTVDIYKTTFVQAKAIQELSKKVEDQNNQINELKQLVEKLLGK